MNPSFSERLGLKKTRTELLRNKLSPELRNTLWNIIYDSLLCQSNDVGALIGISDLAKFYKRLYLHYFKKPVDLLNIQGGKIYGDNHFLHLRDWYFKAKWYDVYDFIEFCLKASKNKNSFKATCNLYLKKELSAYRFIDDILIEINSKEEIQEIENAINIEDKYKPIKTHLKSALEHLSGQNPDYRNSFKESISAVESCCNIILDENLTLGQAIKKIDKMFEMPRGIKSAFSALYGYASNEDGIRHGSKDQYSILNVEEARLMLISSSAFINYLLSKND